MDTLRSESLGFKIVHWLARSCSSAGTVGDHEVGGCNEETQTFQKCCAVRLANEQRKNREFFARTKYSGRLDVHIRRHSRNVGLGGLLCQAASLTGGAQANGPLVTPLILGRVHTI